MLEAYTALGGLSSATEHVQLGTLVTGNTYRNPTLLAKAITTLDVISQGRAVLGIGTGWFELEHDRSGYEFGTFTDRFNKLGEALQIILPMLEGERPTVAGKYYRTQEAMAEPRFRDHIPLMIGGSGEKKTIPLAAKHFDHLNVIAGFDELPRKVQVVQEACEKIGRDPATLETSMLVMVLADENVTADMIPEDFRGNVGLRHPRTDRRADQDQGARRGHRRRHPQPGHERHGISPGNHPGAGRSPQAGTRWVNKTVRWAISPRSRDARRLTCSLYWLQEWVHRARSSNEPSRSYGIGSAQGRHHRIGLRRAERRPDAQTHRRRRQADRPHHSPPVPAAAVPGGHRHHLRR